MLLAAPAAGQMQTPACARVSDDNLPPDLAQWAAAAVPVAAAAGPGQAVPALAPGQRATIALQPAASVTLIMPPEQERTPDAPHAGLVSVAIPSTGSWRVSASKGLWIDVLAGGRTRVASTAFGPLAPCTSIHKVVEFPLAAGDYVIQLSGNPGASVDLMVSRKP